MNTDELKIDLINKIKMIDDLSLLEEMKQLLDFETNENVYQLSDEQKKEVSMKQKQNTKRGIF